MSARRLVLVLACGASLGACAAQAPAPALGPVVDAQPAPPVIAADASPYGLFLAGRAARDDGRLRTAAAYFARAAEDEGEPDYLKASAFRAAVESGDVAGAAALAPSGPDAAPGDLHLAALVRGVEALAEGKDKDAYAQLSGPSQGFPYKMAAALLAPFAAAGAGDAAQALARPELGGEPLAQFVGDLDQTGLYERLGQTRKAEAGYKMLLQTSDAGGVVTASYGAFLERHGRAAEAVALYRAALSRYPDEAGLQADLARALRRGRPPPQPKLLQSAAQSLILPAAGLVAERQGELALIYLRLALRLDPDNDEAWLLIGDLLEPEDREAARLAYERVGPASPHFAAARSKLAYSYENAGDRDAALKLARQTAAALPHDRDAQVTLADLLRDDDQYAQSAEVLTRLIETPGVAPDWRLYYLRASAYDDVGDAAKTEADLAQALKLDPDEPELLNFQGYFWIDRGEHLTEALAMVQRAVAAQPESGAMVDSLGWAYYRLGDYKSAVENLETAVTLDAASPEVNDHLGDAYWKVGRKTEAAFLWRRVLTLDPDAKLRARVEQKLGSPLGTDAPAAPPGVPAPDVKTP